MARIKSTPALSSFKERAPYGDYSGLGSFPGALSRESLDVSRMGLSNRIRAVAAAAAAAVATAAQVALGENKSAALRIVVFFGFECALEQGDVDGLEGVGEFGWDRFAGEEFGVN